MAKSSNKLLEFSNLTLGYSAQPAVHHLTAHVEKNTNLALIGPNGGGKSTLLKSIMGELKPLGGDIHWPNGKVQVGYLPQQAHINLTLPINVADFISLGFWPQLGAFKGLNSFYQDKLSQALADVGLADFHQRLLTSLSGGQQQRVIFARLLAEDAELLLLDEPFAAIDQPTTEQLLSLMQSLQAKGKTLITVMHNLQLVEQHFDQALFLARDLLGFGPVKQLLTPENLAKATNMQAQINPYAPWCNLN